jgi:GxxExxY protein
VVSYKNRELQTKYKPDLFVFGSIIVELKAVSALLTEHEAQVFNSLRISRQPVGYLLNFGRKGELEWKRLIVTDFRGGEQDPEH